MDKITTNTTCTCCEQDTILRIVAGNDFSLRLTLTYKDGDVTRQYDMTDAEDLIVNVVSPNGNRTELDSAVDEFGRVTAVVDAQSLESYVPYDIEVIWRDDVYDKRAAAPNLFSFVNSSREANDVQDVIVEGPYDYNLEILSDVAYVSVGEIPDIDLSDYYTKTEIDDTLSSYVTNSSLDEMSYATTQYVDDAMSDIDLSDYYTKTEVDTTLNSYGTSLYGKGWKIVANPDYVLSYQVQLKNDDNVLSEVWIPAHNKTKNTNNEWYTPFWSALIRSDDYISMLNGLDTLSTIQSDYINNDTLNTTLSSYVNDAAYDSVNHNILLKNGSTVIATIDASPFIIDGMLENVVISNGNLVISFNTDAGKQDITIPISDIFDASNYYTKNDIDVTLADYVTTSVLNSTLSDYVTNTSLSTTLGDYALESDMTAAEADITSLDGRVTTLENNPSVPSNVVTSDDGNEIVCLTQSEYDTLDQGGQLDPDVFYYITDTTSNYVTNSSLTTTLNDYATKQYVNSAISGVTIDETNLVHKTGSETITGEKTFTAQNSFNYGSNIQYDDNLYGFYKSSLFSRGSFNQACIGEIILPNQSASNSSWSLNNVANEVGFYTVTGGPSTMSKTQVAKIDSTGIYEGSTLLSDKYALKSEIPSSSGVSEEDWDNANEAIAQEFVNNRLDHQTINSNFSNYYTKTETDGRYATQSWANGKFVTQADDVNRQQAIAAAFASSVQSTTVHNIWTGSQNDYDAITTKDTNTLYVIL